MHFGVDIDDIQTWPRDLLAWTKERANCTSHGAFRPDSLQVIEDDPTVIRLLRGRQLISYHASRLLAEDITKIKSQGLRSLTPALISERLLDARKGGYLSESEYSRLETTNVFAIHNAQGRAGNVCLMLGRAPLS